MSDITAITMDQLAVGLYIYLDLKWIEQPFAFGNFRIKNEEQIRIIRGLGLATVRYNPALSSVTPAPAAAPAPAPVPAPASAQEAAAAAADSAPLADIAPALAAKQAMLARAKHQREASARVAEAFADTARTIRTIDKNLLSQPGATVKEASALVGRIADAILSEPELAIHVMADNMGGDDLHYHSLNVTVLSMMMARDIALPAAVIGTLGMGALFHDIGNLKVPERLLGQASALTSAERHFVELHTSYGAEIAQQVQLAAAVQAIIAGHHEFADGSGYPAHLKGEAIGLLTRIVTIANYYDELCNPPHLADAVTPHEALSQMFAKERVKFDAKLLQLFIRCLGVYPPGTIVQLSNGVIGMVTSVNTARPMKPIVMVHDPSVPKEEAVLVDMAHETEFNIAKAVRPAQVPREVYAYLSPRRRVSYYFDGGKAGAGAP